TLCPRAEAGGPPFRAKEKRGLLGLAEPSLMHGGRIMGEYSEAFVAFDVSKMKHAVAIADGGRGGEVRFLGDISSSPGPVERLTRKLAGRYGNRERFRVGSQVLQKLRARCNTRYK